MSVFKQCFVVKCFERAQTCKYARDKTLKSDTTNVLSDCFITICKQYQNEKKNILFVHFT